jgi:hypothetical protein
LPPAKSLTLNIIAKRTPLLIERDYPDGTEQTCCFCDQRFLPGHTKWRKTWEHLDNNKQNEELWNLAWAHWWCNEKKKNDADMQIYARELIKKNLDWQQSFDSESARERERENKTDEQTEIDLNVAHRQIVSEFLAEKIPNDSLQVDFNDAINCIVLRCETQTGHGSKQSVRNYIDVQCCTEGKYTKEKIKGKTILKRRTGN